ncbi:hypothetical protein ACH5RR_038733 [Cinchona calisaya]|uniref:PGG domain-containing protein n=1 Tax=Cinchona calisaya TaxID=153742 RepID=A0ABD2XZ65_9GENT
MADAARTNFYFQSGRVLNVQFVEATHNTRPYSQTTQEIIMSSRQAIFALMASAMLNFLQLKYQGKVDQSPFQTHPITMLVAVASLTLYCLSSYNAKLIISSSYESFFHISTAFFGALSLASLSLVLVPNFVVSLPFSLAILFSLCQLPGSEFRRIWKGLYAAIRNKFYNDNQRQVRRGGNIVSAHVPWLHPEQVMDQVDIFPPV